jgi:tRNA dimethylallyltransferase
MIDFKDKIIIIAGPTATGKSQLALDIAKKVYGEIINTDSIQVYKDIPILTAQPDQSVKSQVKHHLYGFIEATKSYSVADWLSDCLSKINQVEKNNKIPILVGGTGMYIDSLTRGLRDLPNISEENIKKTNELLEKKGLDFLYNNLVDTDKGTKEILNQSDKHRIIRAYNLYLQGALTPTQVRNKPNKKFFPDNKFIYLLISPEREELYKNCDDRFKKIINSGAIEEVKNLIERKITKQDPINKAIGFTQIYSHLKGELEKEKAISKSQQLTRNYAKRQNTWFKNQLNKNLEHYVAKNANELSKLISSK